MKYTKDEYIRLGRTLQKSILAALSDEVFESTTVAVTFKNKRYKTLYEIKTHSYSNPFDTETITREIKEFDLYQEMLDYLDLIGFMIDELAPAKGLKITF